MLFANLDPFTTRLAPSEGGGAGDGLPADDPATDVEGTRETLLARYKGDTARAIDRLLEINERVVRQRNALRENQIPKDGIALTAEQAVAWTAYQALGAPKEVADKLTAGETHGKELLTLRRTEAIRAVADASGFKPTVLTALDAQAGGLEYEVKDETKDGQTVKVAYVKDGAATVPVATYADSHWADFLPSLRAAPVAEGGPRFVAQTLHGAPAKDAATAFFEKAQAARDAQPNALSVKPPVVATGL